MYVLSLASPRAYFCAALPRIVLVILNYWCVQIENSKNGTIVFLKKTNMSVHKRLFVPGAHDDNIILLDSMCIDSDTSVVISSVSRIHRLNLWKMLIHVGVHSCIHKSEYAWVYVSLYYILKKYTVELDCNILGTVFLRTSRDSGVLNFLMFA